MPRRRSSLRLCRISFPADTAHFVGRAEELRQLSKLLDIVTEDGATVVISAVSGTAGVGKTALALRWAHRVRGEFPDGQLAASAAGIPPCEHLTVQLHWAPGDRRRADADNLTPLKKACCDALARGRKDLPGLHLVPDDTPRLMTKLMPVIEPPPAEGLWLTVEVDLLSPPR